MPTKKINSPKLEDVLFNLCQQVEKQNNLLSGLVEAELAHNSSIQTLGGIIRGNLLQTTDTMPSCACWI